MTRSGDVWSTPGQAIGLFLRGATLRAASKIALTVGTILSAVNQGSLIWAGHATGVTWLRVSVNYLTPFVVASIGYLAARREQKGHQ